MKHMRPICSLILVAFLGGISPANDEQKLQGEYSFWGKAISVDKSKNLCKIKVALGITFLEKGIADVCVSCGVPGARYQGMKILGKLREDSLILLYSIWPTEKTF